MLCVPSSGGETPPSAGEGAVLGAGSRARSSAGLWAVSGWHAACGESASKPLTSCHFQCSDDPRKSADVFSLISFMTAGTESKTNTCRICLNQVSRSKMIMCLTAKKNQHEEKCGRTDKWRQTEAWAHSRFSLKMPSIALVGLSICHNKGRRAMSAQLAQVDCRHFRET